MKCNVAGDVLPCEEQLRSTLYCDDKDNLRKKLAQLRREYLKTAQKLKRAEQLAVQKHVKNEVTPYQGQADQEEMSKSSFGGGPAVSSCSDTVWTPLQSTPEQEHHDSTCASRDSPALRLRSRRSRIRLQNRGEEGEKSQGEATFSDKSQSFESPSPSLLLSHWSVPPIKDTSQEEKIEADVTDNGTVNKNGSGEVDEGHVTTEEKSCENLQNEPHCCSVEGEDHKSLLETCTMVEGLPFPAEYYVRTTRRMTLARSQPDLRGVIHMQLCPGRPRRKKASPPSSVVQSDPISGSETLTDSVLNQRVTRSGRGRKSQRGRRRVSPRVQRPSASRDFSPLEVDSPKSCPTPGEVDAPQPTSPSVQPSLQSEQQTVQQKVFPIFQKMAKPTLVNSGSEGRHSFLFPCPCPLPMKITQSDLHQDFYLPDDQFASLKLIKLRQVTAESGIEPFVSSSHNTGAIQPLTGTPATALKVPLSLAPTPEKSSNQSNIPRSTDVELPATSHSDHRDSCQSPGDQKQKCEDLQQEALPLCDRPLEDGINDKNLRDGFPKEILDRDSVNSQLPLSPPVASAPLHPPPSSLHSSPVLPKVGPTPHASSPIATTAASPCLSLPPPLSPCNQALSPPTLSPHTSSPQIVAAPRADPPILVPVDDHRRCTLKVPAGGSLVDACCLLDPVGQLCIAAAGRWAVCLWHRESSSYAWSLRHTWAFNKPVISVFPIPDASGLMCVTLGQLEVKEVRVLSCCGGEPTLLLDGSIQLAVGVAKSRVVTSSNSSHGCSLQVFTLSTDGSTFCCLSLCSPGSCVKAVAPVDALPDALVGTNERGQLFVWNLRNGHLLQKINLDGCLSHSSCLRGFSCNGVLLVLLQHLSIGSFPNVENTTKDKMSSEQEKQESPPLFSLVALNPLSGKSVLAARFLPPASWSGRLSEAGASDVAVVGLNHNGGVCVWPLRRQCKAFMVTELASDGEGWQLAHWADGGDTLLTGHHNGDVTLHFELNT
ncbi:partner and localizer of BRCA2 [Stigmatopora argus]